MKKIIVKNLLEEENKKLKEENKLLISIITTLQKQSGLQQYNIPMQTNIIKNGEWCHCGYWKQYGIPDNHYCTGYKVIC